MQLGYYWWVTKDDKKFIALFLGETRIPYGSTLEPTWKLFGSEKMIAQIELEQANNTLIPELIPEPKTPLKPGYYKSRLSETDETIIILKTNDGIFISGSNSKWDEDDFYFISDTPIEL